MSAICLDNVSKTYSLYRHGRDRLIEVITGKPRHREIVALHPITLDIPKGRVIGVIGQNGAGKSTLLKLIAGTIAASGGQMRVNGRISALLELGTGFHPEMTGRDNVYLKGAIMGLRPEEIGRLYADIVAFAGIKEFMDQPVKTYSSGMLMRLAFAVETCVEPDILILDEILSVGDGAFARKSFDRIMHFRTTGATILFCSHSMYQVEAICDRVIWLDRGRVRLEGPPADVITQYQAFLANLSAPVERPDLGPPLTDVLSQPVATPDNTAHLLGIEVRADGRLGRELNVTTGKSEVSITVSFASDAALPSPSVAVAFVGQDGSFISSASSQNDGLVLSRTPEGIGEITVRFPDFALLKGTYLVDVYLLCENGVHRYDRSRGVAEFTVQQQGLEQGIVSLPRVWVQRSEGESHYSEKLVRQEQPQC
jgi:lipopolysaccharide transport system ATP-binding protein